MEGFGPLLFVIILYLCFVYPLSKARKTGIGQKKPALKAPAVQEITEDQTAEAEEFTAQADISAPVRSPFGGDDELYRGSLNAVTGEGTDPCHEEQMESLRAEPEISSPETPAGGLQMNWTGSEIVRGFVISEVLKRKN